MTDFSVFLNGLQPCGERKAVRMPRRLMGYGSSITIPAERRQLAAIRDFVARQAGRAANATQDEIQDLVQAVDEAATNIVIHGYEDGPGTIEIEFVGDAHALKVLLRDHAPVFDPTRVPAPNLDLPLWERLPGGLGIHLVRMFVDQMAYRTTEAGGNELALIKHLGS
jgi:anti-sigma regulatory factor (Ser/Thr protein kinase)